MKYSYSESLKHMLIPYFICAILWIPISKLFEIYFSDQIIVQLLVDLVATIIVFIQSLLINNSSIYDPYWHVIPLFYTTYWCLESNQCWPILICYFYCLKQNISYFRFWPGLSYEDFRYAEFNKKINNKALYWIFSLVAFHIYPTVIVYVGYIPLYYVITNTDGHNCLFEVGITISSLGVIIQWIADYQLYPYRIKQKTGNCEVGLWNYCRHPNYLGECLLWWGMYVSVLSFGYSYYKLGIGALVIQIMFLTYSIPNMENHLKKTIKTYYIYQQEVNSFIPWFRKQSKKY